MLPFELNHTKDELIMECSRTLIGHSTLACKHTMVSSVPKSADSNKAKQDEASP